MIVAAGLVSLALFAVLVDREIQRVRMSVVGPASQPRLRQFTIPRWFEVALWVASTALLLPRVVGLLT